MYTLLIPRVPSTPFVLSFFLFKTTSEHTDDSLEGVRNTTLIEVNSNIFGYLFFFGNVRSAQASATVLCKKLVLVDPYYECESYKTLKLPR